MKAIVLALFASALLQMAAPAAAAPPAPPPTRPPAAENAAAQKLDLNRATLEELLAVPGIGERLAHSILDLRSRKGAFSSIDELLEIRGIGEKSIVNLAEYLVVAVAAAGRTAGAPR